MKNLFLKFVPGALIACSMVSVSFGQASFSFVEDVPDAEVVLFGTPNGEGAQGTASGQATFGFRPNDDAGTEGTRARGQSFTFASGDGLTHDIGGFSVSLNTPADDDGFRPNGQLELTVFQWDSNDPEEFTNWSAGTGGVFNTGHIELFRQSFPILSTDSWGNGDLAQISFSAGDLQLTDGTSYAFLFRYTLDDLNDADGNPLNEDVSFAFDTRQDNGTAGALLQTNAAVGFENSTHVPSASRDMNFFFTSSSEVNFARGDVNRDGSVNFLDISPFISVLSNGDLQFEADVNEDNSVDFLDISPFIGVLSGA